MMTLRKAHERGHADHGWLNSHHSFSFGSYYDQQHMGVSSLRVINDDRIAPNSGFPEHAHNDMEIVSYVLDGELEHKDSMGNGSIIRPGDVQRMSAGTGVSHSEYNPSADKPVHFLQIWLKPNALGVTPSYAQQCFPVAERRDRWELLISPDGREGSIAAHTDARMCGTLLSAQQTLSYDFADKRQGYLHVARGRLKLGEVVLQAGDGVKLNQQTTLSLTGVEEAEVLLFDLP